MLPEVFYFLKGYVIIKINGSFPEKFINMALCRNVYIWDIKKVDRNTVTLKISERGFAKIREVAEHTACTAYIIKESGLPYIVKRYRKRTAMLGGMCAFTVAVFVMSAFLWEIEIEGNDRIPTALLAKQLESAGLKSGAYIKNIDTNRIIMNVMAENGDISWMTINFKGTKATVEVAEGAPRPEMFDKDTVCSIVSQKDGVIEEIITRSGFPVVKRGDTVREGQLLVSGVTDSPAVVVRGVHSDADIKLRCWYDKTASVALEGVVRKPQEEIKTRYRLIIAGKPLNLYFGGEPFEEYDLETSDKYFPGGINIQKNVYTRVLTEEYRLSEEEALEKAKKQIEDEITKQDSCELVNAEYAYEIRNGFINVNARIETIEDAGEKIIINQ